ncbi:MAG: protease modulator HflK [Candidatus Scalindua sp.]|nr:protease modulator HflK [Candidatus Scalindua sp.]
MVNDKATDQLRSVIIIRAVFDHTYRYRWIMLLITIVAISLYQGFYTVKIGEVATLRRFGKLVHDDIQPGLFFRIPWGVDKIDKVLTSKIYNLNVDGQISPALPMLTGDFNYIMASLDVQYQITDPEKYLFRNELPIAFMNEFVRSKFIDTVSTMFIDMVLSTDKAYVEKTILKTLQNDIDNIGLGITLLTINLTLVTPPEDAIAAFRAVNDAKSKKLQLVNDAKTRYEKTMALAYGEHDNIIEKARSLSIHRLETASSDASRFNDILREKKKSPEQTLITEYWKSVKDILGKAKIVVLTPGQDPNIAVNLLRGPTEQIPQLSKMKDVHQIPAETEEPGTHIHLKNLKIENLELEYTKPVRKHTIIRQLPQLPISLQLIHSLIISQEREVIVITIKLQNLNKKIILSELSHIHYL